MRMKFDYIEAFGCGRMSEPKKKNTKYKIVYKYDVNQLLMNFATGETRKY